MTIGLSEVIKCFYSSPPPRREAEDQLTPVPLATTTDRPPYHSDAPSPSKKETEQVDHSQHPVFQTFSDPSSSRAPFPIPYVQVFSCLVTHDS